MYLCTMDICRLHNIYAMCLDTLDNLFLNKGVVRFGRVAVVDCSKRTAAKSRFTIGAAAGLPKPKRESV